MELLTDSMAATVRISSEQLYLGKEGQSRTVQRKTHRNRHAVRGKVITVCRCHHMETAIGIMATNQSGQILVAEMAVQVSRRRAVDGTIAEEGYLWKAARKTPGTSEGRKDFCRRKVRIMCITEQQRFEFM